MISASEALERLRAGNRRFVSDVRSEHDHASEGRRAELAAGQAPFAVILGCSDSRVPSELIFDQGLGDLFVIRVAGNIVAASQIGSIEFAVDKFGSPLVVVVGHTQCGAIGATLDALEQGSGASSPSLQFIVDRVRPAIEPLYETELRNDRTALYRESVRANIRASVHQLKRGSEILEQLILNSRLLIVGAEYSLETGEVAFLDYPSSK